MKNRNKYQKPHQTREVAMPPSNHEEKPPSKEHKEQGNQDFPSLLDQSLPTKNNTSVEDSKKEITYKVK